MTKQEAIHELMIHKSARKAKEVDEALGLAISALTDPEWLPNTGTKPECEYVWVRFANGSKECGESDGWFWDNVPPPSRRITHYIPIPAPPEFVKPTKYFVKVSADKTAVGVYLHCGPCFEPVLRYQFPNNAKGYEAAQSIADIYEEQYQ